MTTVKEMSGGCVPIVLNKGSYKETVDEKTGFRFEDKNGAIGAVIKLASDKKLFSSISKSQRPA